MATASTTTTLPTVLLLGAENAGKSTLLATMTGRLPRRDNLPGTTTSVTTATTGTHRWSDTPGLRVAGDTDTTRRTLAALAEGDVTLVLVVAATAADTELDLLLPLVEGQRGIIVLSFADRLERPGPTRAGAARQQQVALRSLAGQIGVPVTAVDTRDTATAAVVQGLLDDAGTFTVPAMRRRLGWALHPPPTILDRPRIGPWLALAVTLLPVGLGVAVANLLAGRLDPLTQSLLAPVVAAAEGLAPASAAVLAGDYGLLTMGPLLLVWALPTVVVVAVLQGLATASGLADRLGVALDPLTRGVGLQGRDLIGVVMGFGCNVPAVIGTRSCAACTRDTAIASIAWGAACSYQLPASVAVFAAAGSWWLVWPYLLLLAATTLAYARLVSRPQRQGLQLLPLLTRRAFLVRPRGQDVRRQTAVVLVEFLRKALPIFLLLSVVAAMADHLGVLDRIASVVDPAMGVVGLPAETATAVVLAAVRKDGILLLEQSAPLLSSWQLLTAVFLAGSLLPCLVTATTIARERGARLAGRLVARQAGAALAVTGLLGLAGRIAG